MQSGLLSGPFSVARAAALPDGDWRRRSADFQGDALVANLALADALGAIGQRSGTTAGAVAIAWTLAFAGVAGSIVGARSPEPVDGWIGVGLELSAADLDDISAAIERIGADEGPTRP